MAKDRAKDQKRQAGPWPTPIGMGAHLSPEDFYAAKERQAHHKAEEAEYEKGGMGAVTSYRERTGYSG